MPIKLNHYGVAMPGVIDGNGTSYFSGNSETAALLRAFDWSGFPPGSPDQWPEELHWHVRQVLTSKFASWVTIGPELHVIYNDAFCSMIGEKHPGAMGIPLSQLWSEIWPVFEPSIKRALAGESVLFENASFDIIRDGSLKSGWFTFSLNPALEQNSRFQGVLCIATETTGQVLAERALREANELLLQQVDTVTRERDQAWKVSQDALMVLTFEGIVHDVNPAWKTILGFEAAELIGRNIFDLIHPADIDLTIDALKHTTNHALPFAENRYRHKDGSYRWLRWTAAPGEQYIYANGRHVTEERERKEALLRSEDALRQAQKMEAVGQLTGGLAHDFNNMLAGVMGNLELIKLRIASGRYDTLSKYVDSAVSVSQRAAALTHRLLAFSRRQTLDAKPTNTNSLIRSMDEFLTRTLGPEVELVLALSAEPWDALCDQNQLESALLNLAINSRDAMPGGGRLTIETTNVVLEGNYAETIYELNPGEYIVICVSDSGVGMSRDTLTRALDPFFTTKPLGQGTGLGLSMIFGFVKQSGGHIKLYSQEGKGSTVKLFLPRYIKGDVASIEASDNFSLPNAEGKKTILLVEDEESLREIAGEMLRDLGYSVVEASDARSAVKAATNMSKVSLLITDVGLPNGMNGRQLADAMRVTMPGLKVLFMTGFAENAVIGNGVLDKGMAVMTKPFPLALFAQRVHELAVDES
jgi:PAS domain S-box-containing protein